MVLNSEPTLLNTPEEISRLNYPDFVAFLRQKNTPPGGEFTVRTWVEQGEFTPDSHLLDLACTTGFSSRRVAELTGCSGAGIDISADAIRGALEERDQAPQPLRLEYQVADACELPFPAETFTHILGGCNFSFIQDREQALRECRRVLRPRGRLCIASFYYFQPPAASLLDEVERVIGFRPQAHWTAEFWDRLFGSLFRKQWELHRELPVVPEAELVESIHRHVFQENESLRQYPPEIQEACYQRLLDTRRVLNRHRADQKFCIQIWEKP